MTALRERMGPLDLISLAGILAGLGISIYLTIVHYREGLLVCGVGGGCETVQESKYATVGPVPVAILGILLMVTLLGLWILRQVRPDLATIATGLSFAALLAGVASEGYLTYVEIWVLEAICQWCVAFAIVLVILLIAEFLRLWRDMGELDDTGYDAET